MAGPQKMELPDEGIPEQQMLQTLVDKIEDMHGRMQQELDGLHAQIKVLLERVPDPACTISLAELVPPPDETAEEEARRIAKDIFEKECWNYDCDCGPYNREVWIRRMRHECNKALLRSNGFDVYMPEENNRERGVYLRWNAISPAGAE